MRIAIFGTGGAGGRFGAQLANAGEDVVFIARGEHLHAILTEGLRLKSPEGDILIHPAEASDDPAKVGLVDLVILGVKTWQVIDAAHAMKPMMGQETFVLPLQNGIEAATQLSEVLGAEHVIGGLCATISWIDGPGLIRSMGQVHFVRFGELDDVPSKRTEELRRTFERAGVDVEIPSDIYAALWEKFLFVVSFGGVGAVTRSPIGVIRTVPEARRMLERCMHEIYAVARGHQISLSDGVIEKTMDFVDSLAPGATASLQRDIVDSRPSELEAWNGAVVRSGNEVGVATPLHEFIYHSLLPLELSARQQVEFPS
ncbi:MAG: 2-dehydropantoate 2-reductase [Chloroflexi bacterium]|nr:MAG: 2-dehydropantoate 2-reductase [Chloroflexota bacterium]